MRILSYIIPNSLWITIWDVSEKIEEANSLINKLQIYFNNETPKNSKKKTKIY